MTDLELTKKWDNKVSNNNGETLNKLKTIVQNNKQKSPLLRFIPINGFAIAAILKQQGLIFEYNRTDFRKTIIDLFESNNEYMVIRFIKNSDEYEYLEYKIKF